jgi:hypothetical protein
MDVKDYCNGVEIELTVWKARLYDLLRRFGKVPEAERENLHGSMEDMHKIISDLNARIEQLRTECPAEWSPQKKEIDDKYINIWSKYEKVMKSIGKF